MAIEPQTDVRTCARTFLARVTRELEEASQRANALRAKALEAAQLLRGFGATGVWLFGSLAWGEPHQGSDVDLLVEGVPAANWPDAARAVERLLAGASVDAPRSEDSPRQLTDRVRAEGIRLT